MKRSVGLRQVSLIVLLSLILTSVVFYLGHQLMNGRFQQSPRALTRSILSQWSKAEDHGALNKDEDLNFHYDFFTLLDKPAPVQELQAVSLETNPAMLAKQGRSKSNTANALDNVELSRFAVQVSSSQRESDARALAEQLRSKGYRVGIVTEDLKDKGKWFRVRIDGGKRREKAEQQLAKIEKNTGLKGFVVEAM